MKGGARGVKNTQIFDHVVYGWPLISFKIIFSVMQDKGFFETEIKRDFKIKNLIKQTSISDLFCAFW